MLINFVFKLFGGISKLSCCILLCLALQALNIVKLSFIIIVPPPHVSSLNIRGPATPQDQRPQMEASDQWRKEDLTSCLKLQPSTSNCVSILLWIGLKPVSKKGIMIKYGQLKDQPYLALRICTDVKTDKPTSLVPFETI